MAKMVYIQAKAVDIGRAVDALIDHQEEAKIQARIIADWLNAGGPKALDGVELVRLVHNFSRSWQVTANFRYALVHEMASRAFVIAHRGKGEFDREAEAQS